MDNRFGTQAAAFRRRKKKASGVGSFRLLLLISAVVWVALWLGTYLREPMLDGVQDVIGLQPPKAPAAAPNPTQSIEMN